MNPVYQTTMTSTGGRDGRSVASDSDFELALSTPKELGGAGGPGTNPEQLFAAGYSACFIGALKYVAAQQTVRLPADMAVTATIGIGENQRGKGFAINASLAVSLPGLEPSQAQQLIDDAHQVCPYSNATRGNIDIETRLV